VQYYRERGGSKYFAQWGPAWREKLRQWFNDLKATLSCQYCGETCPQALDFHHRDPATKRFNLSAQLESFSRKSIEAEIAKCDVVCANCHRKLHAGVPVRDVWQDYLDKLPCTGAA
jgi:Fe-S oxidoreductase